MGVKRNNDHSGHSDRDGRRNGSQLATRAEFEKVLERLDQHSSIINELRREVSSTCRDLADDVRRELQTQFTRIAQLQQEIDALKKR